MSPQLHLASSGLSGSVPRDVRAHSITLCSRSITLCAMVKSRDAFLPTEKPMDEGDAAVLWVSRGSDGGRDVPVNI